jgi:hypothetical protein
MRSGSKRTDRNQTSDRRDALELCEDLRSGIYRAIIHVPRLEVS